MENCSGRRIKKGGKEVVVRDFRIETKLIP